LFAGFAEAAPSELEPTPNLPPAPAEHAAAPFAAFAAPEAQAPTTAASSGGASAETLLPWPPTESLAAVARTPTSGPSFLGALPDATIEQLARQESAEGFIALEPGALSAIAGRPSATIAHTDEWLETRAPDEPLEPTPPAAPEPTPTLTPEPAEPAPDPRDYHARMTQARERRDAGALDEAIIEYRTVVRNAPDLLPDVLSDVEGLLETRPDHPELHRLHGDALIRTGNYMDALESYNRATELSQALDGQ
jgi:tetratricopeptide (TPR) repeat protein